jgi:hypothetical protein
MLSSYPVHLEGNYTNDIEYRIFLRNIFSMNHNCPWDATEIHQIDDVSLDEFDYDEILTSTLLDAIYEETIQIPAFKTLYEKAAAKMMSCDHTIGIAVLFSYSFAYLFHKCISKYITHTNWNFKDQNEFIQLTKLLTK